MSKQYVVRAGDTLTLIARRNGYRSWQEIYYHADNKAFRARRPNPNRIWPGDELALPDGGPSGQAAPPTPTVATPADAPLRPINIFLSPYQIDQILRGPGPRPDSDDLLWRIDQSLKALGPAAKSSNSLDDLARKVQQKLQVQVGDYVIKPDLETIGKGILELLKGKK
jgi:LysM domain